MPRPLVAAHIPIARCRWAGSWNTRFWIDPVKELSGIFMVQYQPFAFVSVGEEFWSLVLQAVTD